ncbi:MAG: DUF2339 domain-containing protein [Gordonia sp. (in: high G+C Gram-positive bacteria)]|uniref:DUF2339 domain-containing protein n=1 Tax=Gordonia sp. (in: high G+C Gram-positive bacteria) TaxID=84139 RepID=UPI0039E6F8CF
MSTTPDPFFTAVTRIGDELTSITARLAKVTDDVAELRDAMETAAPAPAPPAAERLAPDPAVPGPTTPGLVPSEFAHPGPVSRDPWADPASHVPPVAGPAPAGRPSPPRPAPQPRLQYATAAPGPMCPPPVSAPPVPPRPATGDGVTLGKVLAFLGVAITLLGVVFLLVLAAQAGYLNPGVRVAGGAVLAVALVAAGLRIGRTEVKRTAASAVVATGVATALFTVLASANIYHWIPVIAALVLTGMIAAGGFWIAGRWRSQALGVTVGIGLIAFAPFLTHGVTLTLVVFLLVYAAATLAVQIGRDWPVLLVVNTIATAAPLGVIAGLGDRGDATRFVLAAAACFLLAVGSAAVLLRTSRVPLVPALVTLIPVLPLIGASPVVGGTGAAILLGAAAAVLAGLTAVGPLLPGSTRQTRIVWLSGAVAAGVIAIGLAGEADGLTLGLLGIAVVFGVAARHGDDLGPVLRIIATVCLGIGLLALAAPGITQLATPDSLDGGDRVVVLIGSLLAIAALVALVIGWSEGRPDTDRHTLAGIACLIGLVLFNVLCVAIGALASGGSVTGFRAGHMCATIGFVAAGAAALLWARRLRGSSRTLVLTAGLVVIGGAVAKLFLFDLAALAGIFRVIAFIVVGLVLLGLGVAYAQSLNDDDPVPPPTGPNPNPNPSPAPYPAEPPFRP